MIRLDTKAKPLMPDSPLRATAVLTVRNEGAFLLEWLAHHRAVGFSDFLVFSNDCDDGTEKILDHMQDMGVLTHISNDGPYDKSGIQFTALKTADKHKLVKKADWLLCLDIDEFVNIHTGDGTLDALFATLPHADAITLTWRLFGNADTVRFSDRPLTDQFQRSAPDVIHWPWRAAMFKTLYRNNGLYRKLGVHRPRAPRDEADLESYRWFDGSGRELDGDFKTKRLFSNYGQNNFAHVQLNHYPLGAMESFILKSDRGRVNHADLPIAIDYWIERNYNQVEDTSISRYRHARDALMTQWLQDEKLEKLHKRAVQWRHERFAKLMRQDPFRALFSRLMMAAPSRVISAGTARTLTGFSMLGQHDVKTETRTKEAD